MNNPNFLNASYSVVFAERRDIGCEWNNVKWDRYHNDIQYHRLYYLTQGNAKLTLMDTQLYLEPGHVYFVPAFSVIRSNITDKMNKYYIHFQSDLHVFSLYRYLSDKYSVEADDLTERLFRIVVENYSKCDAASRLKVQGAMNLMLSDFLKDANVDVLNLGKFDKVIKYIEENYSKKITLSELAQMMNISTLYFSNYFKRVFRVSPKQYILNKRLTESQRLLLESRLSIKEIAYSVGFENENYFSEFFASKVGISALKFRNRELPTTRESIL